MKALFSIKKEIIALSVDNQIISDKNKIEKIYKDNQDKINKLFLSIPEDTKQINLFNTHIEVISNTNTYKYNLNMFSKIKESIAYMKDFFNQLNISAKNYQKRIKTNIISRDYQDESSNNILFHQKGMVYAPTGSGKTNIMCYTFAKNPQKTLIIVPTKELVKQTKSRFLQVLNIDESFIGIINSDVRNKRKEIKHILITTWQSIKNEVKELIKQNNYSMIFVDEAHHSSANVINSTIKGLLTSSTRLYGFSATPYRTQKEDEQKVFNLFDNKVISKIDIDKLYNENFLVKPQVFLIENKKNYSLSNIAKENFLKNLFQKKYNESLNIADFIESSLKIVHFVILDKTLSIFANIEKNNQSKKVTYNDIETAKNILIEKVSSFEDFQKIIFEDVISIKENEDKYIKMVKDCYKIYADDFIKKNNQYDFYKEFDFSQKIGYLKKSIDNDSARTNIIADIIYDNLLENELKNTIILVNTLDLIKIYQTKFHSFLQNKKLNLDFFIVTGSNSKDLDIIKKNSKKYILLATTDFLREGIDIPNAEKIFCVSPVFPPFAPSYALEQIIGRAIRPFENKKIADIYVFNTMTSDFKMKKQEILTKLEDNLKIKIRSMSMFDFFKNIKEQKISKILESSIKWDKNSQIAKNPYLIKYFIRKDDKYYCYDSNNQKQLLDLKEIKNLEEYKKLNDDTFGEVFYLKKGIKTQTNLYDELSKNPKGVLGYSISDIEYARFNSLLEQNTNKNFCIAEKIFKQEDISVKTELKHFIKNPFLQEAIKNKTLIIINSSDFNYHLIDAFENKFVRDEESEKYILMCDNAKDLIEHIKFRYSKNEQVIESLKKAEIVKIDKFDTKINPNLFNFILNEFIRDSSLFLNLTKNNIYRTDTSTDKLILETLKMAKTVLLFEQINNFRSKNQIIDFFNDLCVKLYKNNESSSYSLEKLEMLDELYNLIPPQHRNQCFRSYQILKQKFEGFSFNPEKHNIKNISEDYLKEIITLNKIQPLIFNGIPFYKIDKKYTNLDENYIFIDRENKESNSLFYSKRIEDTIRVISEKEYNSLFQHSNSFPIFYNELNKSKEELVKMLESDRYIKLYEIENKDYNEKYIYVLDNQTNESYRFTFDEITDEVNKVQQYDFNIYAKILNDLRVDSVKHISKKEFEIITKGKTRLEQFLMTSPLNSNFLQENLKEFNDVMEYINKTELNSLLKNNFSTQYIARHLMTKFEDINKLEQERFIKDFAFQLSNVNNFLGQYNYTTLQHSVNVSKIAVFLAKQDGINDENVLKDIQFKALFHDAIEMFISDIPTPIKEQNPLIYKIEDKIGSIIYNFLNLKKEDTDVYISRADKLERQTFIDLYMRNEKCIEDSLKSFINRMLDEKVIEDTSHIKEIAKNIIIDYKKYLNNEEKLENLSNLTQKWIKDYRLSKDSFGLNKKEIDSLGLDLELNRSQIDVIKSFCSVYNELNNSVKISINDLKAELDIYNNPQKINEDVEDFLKEQIKSINTKIDENEIVFFTQKNEHKTNTSKIKL